MCGNNYGHPGTLLIIDRRGVSIMSAYSRTRRVTHLTFNNARVEMDFNDGETEGLFGVSEGIQDITRSSGMVRRIRFIYGKVFIGFRKSSGFFRYRIGKF